VKQIQIYVHSFSADFHFLTNLSSLSENSSGFPNFRQKRKGFHASGTFEKKTTTTTKQQQKQNIITVEQVQSISLQIFLKLYCYSTQEGFNYVWRGYDEK